MANRRLRRRAVRNRDLVGIDGTVLTSDLNFLRIFPQRQKGLIDIGLIKLRPGADAAGIRDAMKEEFPSDVVVLTKQDYIQREKYYWNTSTPIGYVFTFGVIMGFVVGAIIVYQILFADVSDHLAEYATLKAMGYPNRYLFGVVFQEAVLLAVLRLRPRGAHLPRPLPPRRRRHPAADGNDPAARARRAGAGGRDVLRFRRHRPAQDPLRGSGGNLLSRLLGCWL
jgi:DevC protein